MQEPDNDQNIEGGTPSPSGPKGPGKHRDDADVPSEVLDQQAVEEAEEHNMTGHKGYNEVPADVPVTTRKRGGDQERTF
jgi:hypothetical protein